MRVAWFGILRLGLGGWCVAGLPSGNGTARDGRGGVIKLGRDGGEDGGRVDATTLTRSWVAGSDVTEVVGTAGPTKTTPSTATENTSPSSAVTADRKEDLSIIVTATLDTKSGQSINGDFTSTKTTARIEGDGKEPSTARDAGADSITKDVLSVITLTTTMEEEEIQEAKTTMRGCTTCSSSSASSPSNKLTSMYQSGFQTSTKPLDASKMSSWTLPVSSFWMTDNLSKTADLEVENFKGSIVSSSSSSLSRSSATRIHRDTSTRETEKATAATVMSSGAEVTSETSASGAAIHHESVIPSVSTISGAEPKTTKSASLSAPITSSSGAEKAVDGRTRISKTTHFDSTDLARSSVLNGDAKTSLSMETSGHASTSSMNAGKATVRTSSSADGQAATKTRIKDATTGGGSISSVALSTYHGATGTRKKSASFKTLVASTTGSVELVSGSTISRKAENSNFTVAILALAEATSKNVAAHETSELEGTSSSDSSMPHTATETTNSASSKTQFTASNTGSADRVSVGISASQAENATSTIMTLAHVKITSKTIMGHGASEGEGIIASALSLHHAATEKAENATSTIITPGEADGTSSGRTPSMTTPERRASSSASSLPDAETRKAENATLIIITSAFAEATSRITTELETTGFGRSSVSAVSLNGTSTIMTDANREQTSTPSASTQKQRTGSSGSAVSYTAMKNLTESASFTISVPSSSQSLGRMFESTRTREAASTAVSTQERNASLISSFTQHDGNAEEFDGPLRTSSYHLLTGSIRSTSTSKLASTMATQTTPSRSFTTSFTSRSSSILSSTSVTSSMRPKMTDCIDDFDFFEMTDGNLAESGTIAWYADWTSRASFDPAFNTMGEVPYFGRVWLRNPDYNCGLELGGCTQRPSCNEILKLYPGDPDMARRVYFTMKMQATVNQVMKSYYDAVHLTQTNLASVMKKIVDTSFQSTSMDDMQACQFLKTAYNNMYNLMAELAMPILNGKQGLGGEWFKGPLKSPENPSAEGVRWLQFADPYGAKNQGFSFWKGKGETAYRWWMQEALGSMAASTGMCEGLGMVNLNKGGAEESMRNALLKISQFQRKELSQHVQSLNQGAFQGEGDMSALAGMLGMGIWSNESSSAVDLLTDPYQLEEMMTTQSKDALLSRAYLMNKCYLKCTTHPHASLLCEGYNDWEFAHKHAQKHGYPYDSDHPGPGSKMSAAEKLMRICPEPNKVCQVECWSQEKKGFSQPLHNIGQLGSDPLDVDIQQKMREIYAYYKEHGNVDPRPEEAAAVKQNPHGKLTGDYTGPHFWLPVCDSEQGYTHIVDFGQQKHGKHHMDQFSRSQDRRSFPISCGSYRSDQTMEFMEAMGLTNWHTKGVGWTMNPFFKNYAPLNAAILIEAPLDNFLALCRLGVQYPQSDTKDTKHGQMDIRREASQFCAPIDEETQDMPWFLANLWFCKNSEAGKALFGLQGPSGGILGLGKVKNHRRLCERWLATWEGEQMVGMEETDGGQGKDRWIGPKTKVKVGEVHGLQYDSKGRAWHPKWRDGKDFVGSLLLGRRGESAAGPGDDGDQRSAEPGVLEALSRCEGTEGIGFGWRFVGLLLGRGGSEAMGEAWKFLFTGHRDLRRYGANVEFEGHENTCSQVKEKMWGQDTLRKRDADGGVGKDEGEASDMERVVVEIDMEEVRREEEWYWKENEEVMKEDEED